MAFRSIIGVINERFDDYIERRKQGYKNSLFIQELKNEGYEVTETYFSRCLNKVKHEREKAAPKKAVKPQQQISSKPEKASVKEFKHNPEPDKSILD